MLAANRLILTAHFVGEGSEEETLMARDWPALTAEQKALVDKHRGLAHAVAKQLWLSPVTGQLVQRLGELEDAVQAGMLGLIHAAECFDVNHFSHATFSKYAWHIIRRQIIYSARHAGLLAVPPHPPADALLKAAKAIRQTGLGLNYDVEEVPKHDVDLLEYLVAATSLLPGKEQEVIMRFYGLDGKEPEGLVEIAQRWGKTRAAVHWRLCKARKMLHTYLEKLNGGTA